MARRLGSGFSAEPRRYVRECLVGSAVAVVLEERERYIREKRVARRLGSGLSA